MKTEKIERNLTMLVDFYELAMANGYFKNGFKDTVGIFDMFYRSNPDNGGFVIMAGVEQLTEYLSSLSFSPEDIDYLRGKGFCEEFLNYLKNFEFKCDVWAVPEGTPVFPGETLVKVRGPIIQAQMIETMLLICINHQSLIATKANRIVRAAQGRAVMEFGSRRAQGCDGAVYGARAACMAGCVGTACVICDEMFGAPALGTMAHSWVQLFDSEYDAFKAFASEYPDNCTLLVDTFNVLKSGVPNAIRVFDEVLKPLGKRPKGIRIDSGDITYLSKKARKMLDEAGYEDCGICASNSLDEYIIRDMLLQGAKINSFGVGERLITSSSSPVLGGVYKLCGIESGSKVIPKIKLSENVQKITTPGNKEVYRIYDNATGKATADLIALADEKIDFTKPLELFDPEYTWKKKVVTDYTVRKLLEPLFEKGRFVGEKKSLLQLKEYCGEQIDTLWDEVKRFENPHNYYVDLTKKLWKLKNKMIEENKF
ncbi:MAG: nicotinate phosphoribosyltransferase [Clostridiales bacterium]|nr:nicotinate phosphoribosyltransferase [Clostridiales bacterium]